MNRYIRETPLLDYSTVSIQHLIESKQWKKLDTFKCIKAIYDYVRNDILFGYNRSDQLSASQVLQDGYGQCNTKGTLFMALLRAVSIPCRLHGFTIRKALQKGAMTGFVYRLAPENVVHSWVEVYFEDRWLSLEGFILDAAYLSRLQAKFSDCSGSFCGYGVATLDFQNPPIDWNGNDTYIQKEGINQDFGVFDAPDDFFAAHPQELSPMKKFAYENIGRQLMNSNVKRIREN